MNPNIIPTDRPSNPVPTSNEITRRNFMKKSALTVGAIALLGQGVGLALGDSASSSKFYLVCTTAPTDEERTPPTYSDGPKVITVIPAVKWKKDDVYTGVGPHKDQHIEIVDGIEAKFEIEASLNTMCSIIQTSGTESWVYTSVQKQIVAAAGGALVWRKASMADMLQDTVTHSPSVGGGTVSGGVELQEGTMKGKSCWASSGSSFRYTLGTTGTIVKIEVMGILAQSDMNWTGSTLEWQFEILDQAGLDAYLNSQLE